MNDFVSNQPFANKRWDAVPLYRWWRLNVVATIQHEQVMARIIDDSRWSGRYVFMIMMSAGIAVLGLLLSSPAVVIGAMLISPLMSPILGLGFGLALFDFAEMRRAVLALAIGSLVAVLFTALIVVASPLKTATAEILARTRPNLFDLLVALFAALAGTFAIIRGKGDTIVGVAIATALMPPLAVVGYGLATWNMAVLGGSLALFFTNLFTIALAATILARLFGFGHFLSSQQSLTQTTLLLLVFIAMSIPLGISLSRIASESLIARQVRSFLIDDFGDKSRVTQLDIDFGTDPLNVRAVVIAPRTKAHDVSGLEKQLARLLDRKLTLQVDQVLLDPAAGAIDTQRAELQQISEANRQASVEATTVSRLAALAAGIAPDSIVIDRQHRRLTADIAPLPGATMATYRALEARTATAVGDWDVVLTPPLVDMPPIDFADGADTIDDGARAAIALSAWGARHWNVDTLAVPGLRPADATPSKRPRLAERRALAIAAVLKDMGITAAPAPDPRGALRLAPAATTDAITDATTATQ